MDFDAHRIRIVLVTLFSVLMVELAGPVIAAAQNVEPRVLAYIQEVRDSPFLLGAFSPAQPGAYTLIAPRSDTYPFPLLSPDSKWMVSRLSSEDDNTSESYIYKLVGTAQGRTIAVVKSPIAADESDEHIECCVFSDDSRFLVFLRILPFSEFSKKWSVNIIELATGVQTTFWTTDRRVKRQGPYGPEVMTELTEIVRVWRAADKRLLFRKYLRFDEADDYPQAIPIGFYALDLSKFDLSKGGTFKMPQMVEFSTGNFSADPFAEKNFRLKVTTNGPHVAPDRTQLAYTYGLYGIYVPMGIGILDLITGKFTEVPLDADIPRILNWISDSKRLVYISAKRVGANAEFRDYRLNVLDVGGGKVVQSVVIDAEGEMSWYSAFVCGDTVFMVAYLKTPPEAPQTAVLFSAALSDPARYKQLFTVANISLERCA
jgi:hypothetical protein